MRPTLTCAWLGRREYRAALALQESLREARIAGTIGDTLLLVEHPPVYTRGRRSRPDELPLGEDHYRAQGIDVVDVRRGGLLTYHGPGQLTGYVIVGVTDVVDLLRKIEQALVAVLAELDLEARSRIDDGPAYTGVWVGPRKIASLGIHVRYGVSTHGFALNVDNDLTPFEQVVPCGFQESVMTSIAREGVEVPSHAWVRDRVHLHLATALDRAPDAVDPARLDEIASTTA